MSDMHEISLRSFFSHSITGEWGTEPIGNKDVTVFRAADFTKDCKLRRDGGVLRAIPPSKLNARRLENNDILIEKSGGSPDQPVGRAVLFEPQDEEQVAVCSNFIQRMVVKECYEPLFVYYLLLFLYEQNATLPYQQQTTGIINLKLDEYLELQVKTYLDRSVQTQIASILKSVDQQIVLTLSQIEKMTLLKQGMTADLFSRGIDPMTGKLRTSVKCSPELYCDTELGLLPKDWLVVELGDVVESISDGPFGSNLKSEHYVDSSNSVVVRLQNIESYQYNDENKAFISDSHADFLKKNKVLPGDVLIAGLGDERYPVGRACCYPEGALLAVNKADCFRARGKPGVLSNQYLMLFLNSELARKQLRRLEQGVTRPRVNTGNLKKIKICLPTSNEQDLFFDRFSSVQTHIDLLQKEQKKLQTQKAGLMRDLLTGKVPVSA